jgi:shikimate kinase
MMSGRAASRGAATIVNAIACGRGAAFGVTLEADASLELEQGDGDIVIDGAKGGAELVSGCVRATASRMEMGPVHGRVRICSDIPVSRGLKSSSAVSNVVVLATARALGKDIDDSELLRIAIDESIRAGVTVTGAFDDAAACYFGGLVVTDNTARKVLKTGSLDQELTVVLHVPDTKIAKSSIRRARFEDLSEEFKKALDLAMKGEYAKAMEANSKATARALDLSDAASAAAREAGAYAAGITGTGPASVALCGRQEVGEVERAFSRFDGRIIRAELNTIPSREVAPRLL